MFTLKLKKTYPINFKQELVPFLKKNYELKDTQKVEKVLDHFDQLRNAAMRATLPGKQSYDAILAYLKEIDYLGHFPIGDKKLKIAFKWDHAYNVKKSISGFDYHLDQLSFLYNLAVLQYQEATRSELDTLDKIKACGTMLKTCCSTFKTILEMTRKRLFNITNDLEDTCIETLYQIAENNASELLWMAAVINKTSPSVVAAVSVHCYEANTILANLLRSEGISKEFSRSFSSIAISKEKLFLAEAYYCAGQAELANKRIGNALAFFARVKDEIHEISKKKMLEGISPAFVSFFNRYMITKIENDYNSTEKDNRLIYNETVPSNCTFPKASKLINVEPAKFVFNVMNDENDPFTDIVPVRVKALLEEYKTQAENLVSEIKNDNNQFSMKTNTEIAKLGLPMSLYEYLGAQISEATRASNQSGIAEIIDDLRANGVNGMMKKRNDLEEVAEQSRIFIMKLIGEVGALGEEDKNKKAQYGQRWNSSGFALLYNDVVRDLDKFATRRAQAASTDDYIKTKINQAAAAITKAQEYVLRPQESTVKGEETSVVISAKNVKSVLDEITDELNKLEEINNSITEMLTTDLPIQDFFNICPAGEQVTRDSHKFKKVVDNNFAKYNDKKQESDQIIERINELFNDLKQANSRFVNEAHGIPQNGDFTDEIKDGLIKYNEIRRGINNGMTFYKELSSRTERVAAKINGMKNAYREEVAHAEAALTAGAPFVIITGMGVDPTNQNYNGGSTGGSGGMGVQQMPMQPSQPQQQLPPQQPAPSATMAYQPQPQQPQQPPQPQHQPQPQLQPQGQPQPTNSAYSYMPVPTQPVNSYSQYPPSYSQPQQGYYGYSQAPPQGYNQPQQPQYGYPPAQNQQMGGYYQQMPQQPQQPPQQYPYYQPPYRR